MPNIFDKLYDEAKKKKDQLAQAIGNGVHTVQNSPVAHSVQQSSAAGQVIRQRQLPQPGQPGFGVMRPGAPVMRQPVMRPVAQVQQPSFGHGFLPSVGNALINNPLSNGLNNEANKVFGSKPALGAERLVGSGAQALVRSGIALNQGIGNAEVGIAHAMGKAPNVHTQNAQQVINGSIGNNVNKAVGYTGTKRQIIGDALNNAAWMLPGAGKGVSVLGEKTAAAVGARTLPVVGKVAGSLVKIGGHAQVAGVTNAALAGTQQLVNDPHPTLGSIAGAAKDAYVPGLEFGAVLSGAHEAVPLVRPAAKAGMKQVKASQAKVATRQAIDQQQAALQAENAAHQANIDKLPLGDHKAQLAAEQYQKKIRYNTAQIDQLEAQRPKLNLKDRVLTAQPGLTVGGPNAMEYYAAKKKGLVFDGVDGKPRFEIDDSGAKFNPKVGEKLPSDKKIIKMYAKGKINDEELDNLVKGHPLEQFLDHPELYKNYPNVAKTRVKIDKTLDDAEGGNFDGDTLRLNGNRTPDQMRKTLLHEVQHRIQKQENFARGTNLEKSGGFKDYHNNAAEAEARAVANRADLPMSKRYVIDKSDTPDTKSLKREIAELDRKINAFDGDSPARQTLIDRQIRLVEELEGNSLPEHVRSPQVKKQASMTSGVPAEMQHLANDAKKYKNIEDFKRSIVSKTGSVDEDELFDDDLVEAVFKRLQETSQIGRYADEGDIMRLGRNARRLEGNKPMTVHRAAPGGKIRPGDMVTDLEGEARNYAHGDNKLITQNIPAKDLIAVDGSIGDGKEFIYLPSGYKAPEPKQYYKSFKDLHNEVHNPAPSPAKRSTFYDSLDVPKDELIIRHDGGTAMSIDKPKVGETRLNTDRLNISDEHKAVLDSETQATIDRMSNAEVQLHARNAGIDTKTHTPEQTRQIIAEQLNVRQDAVRLLEESKTATDVNTKAQLIKQAAERGRTSREQGTDIARQLQARKIVANALDTPEQRIFKLLDNAGVNPDVYSKRLATVDFNNSKEVVKAYRDLVPAKFGNWLDTLRYNSMLSSPLTQAVNIFGNAQGLIIGSVEKNLRGNIDAIGGLFGKPRQYARGEGTAYGIGAARSIQEASVNFADALRGTGKYANSDLEEYSIPLAQGGVKGAAYSTLSFPMKVLDGMDKFFRTMAESGEEAALLKRQSKGIAVKGNRDALKKSEADYRVFQTELGTPGQGALNQAFDEFAKGIMRFRNSKVQLIAVPAKFVVPFVKTVNNINKQGVVDYSPLGLANLAGNADKTTALTRAIMGSAVFGASATLLAQGQMTWAEPRNADERAQFRTDGKQPYAVRFGDHWIGFSKLHPAISFPMAMTAALDDALKAKKINQSTFDSVLEAVSKYGNFLSDQSYAKSIGDALGAIGGDKQAVAQMVSNNVQQVVPFRALTGWLARLTDGTERKINTDKGYIAQQVESLMQQYPGLREQTTTRDNAGIPIAANNQLFNSFSPVKVTKDRTGGDYNAGGSQVASGTRSGSSVRSDVNSQIQAAFSTPEARRFIAMTDAEKKAAAQSDPNARALYEQYQAMKTGLKQDTSLRPEGLSDSSTKTLNKYDRLTPAAKDKVYARDKTAEYKYELARYEQDKLNGLSTTEDIRRQQELQKAAVGADFDKSIRDLYSLNKTQLYKYLSTNPNGADLANQIVAYGDALSGNDLGDNKFRNSKGLVSIKPADKKTGSGSGKSLSARLAEFKTPYDNLVTSSTKGAQLARSAKLAKKRA